MSMDQSVNKDWWKARWIKGRRSVEAVYQDAVSSFVSIQYELFSVCPYFSAYARGTDC
jgi:hypothetical protein